MGWIAALVGAVGSYAASESGKPSGDGSVRGHSRLVPSDNTAGHIDRLLQEYIDDMDRRKNAGPNYYQGSPGGGSSATTNNLIQQLASGQWMDQGFAGEARQRMSGSMGQSSAMQQETFDQLNDYEPQFYDQAIQMLLNGGGSDPRIEQYLDQRSRGNFGGGGGSGPISIDHKALGLGEATNDYDKSVLAGDFLSPDSNPWLAEMADVVRREGHETLVPMARADASGARRYGSAAAVLQENDAYSDINDQITNLYGQNYQFERGNQESASGRLSALDQQKIASGASMANANTAAGASLASAREQAFMQALLGNAGLRMDGINTAAGLIEGLTEADMARFGMMNQAASQDNLWQLGLFDAANTNIGLQGQGMGAALSGSVGADSNRNAAAANRYNAGMARHNYERDFSKNNILEQLDVMSRLGSLFGTNETVNTNPHQNNSNPWLSALAGGASGYLATYDGGNRNRNSGSQSDGRGQWV